MVDDIVVGFEDAVREPVVAHYCQIFSTGLSSGHFGGNGIMVMLAGMNNPAEMPSGLIQEKDGVGSWCDRLGDFREVQVHRFDIAGGQDQSRALALFRADGTEHIGRCGSLIPRSARASAALAHLRVILFFWPIRASSLHEGSAVNGSVAFASPILIDGTSAHRWVRGHRVSQLRLRHLTCGRGRSTVPHHNALMTRRSPGDATHLKRGGVVPPKKKTVAFPVSPPANAAGGISCLSCGDGYLRPDLGASRYYPGLA